ncbi:DUF2637 domain-containing protein [Streptomyces sp. NPDC093225]|uniref:DUF2637 domain-containing protein n=1 Tax=Streptomyces sp. NPDC093225 TaxID=3366034 RepID=UPI0038119CBD
MQLTRTHRILIGVVITGAVVIAGIGFAGSYAAVRALAIKKGFGDFSLVFPIGIDMGICVLLALDLLLTWIRIPFPLLRQTAWLLTAATIAFNGAAAWPDPLGVGMHAVIPVLFVVTVEAARHAVGRIADITADRHMEGVRLTRWMLSPFPTFKLWRRMKLWELRSYEQAVGMEQDRLIYQARLQARYGRAWRRKAPVEALMPLRLARIGVPLAQTAPEGLAAAGIDPVLLPPATRRAIPPGQEQSSGMARPTGWTIAQATITAPKVTPAPVPHREGPDRMHTNDADLIAAGELFVQQRGTLPTIEELAAFLARDFGVLDPETGQLVAEDVLEPVLAQLARAFAETPSVPTKPGMEADNNHVGTHPQMPPALATASEAPHSSFERPTVTAPSPAVTSPGRRSASPPTATVQPQPRPSGRPTQQTSPGVPSTRPTATAPARGKVWESVVLDTGAATAALPEQQTTEPDQGPVQQQIMTVAQWLTEAEEAGSTLSGAEVGRRLGVSPRTGKRRLDKAAEYLNEQRRQRVRARLRAVKG